MWITAIFNDRNSTRSSFDFSTNSTYTIKKLFKTLQDFNLHWRFGSGIPFGHNLFESPFEISISNLPLKSRSQISPFVSLSFRVWIIREKVSGGVLRLNIRLYREAWRKNLECLESNESYAEDILAG